MRKSRYSAEQIAAALRQAEQGTPVAEITRKLGIAEATFYLWKKRFGRLGTPEIRELRQLREENTRLKHIVADLTLDRQVLQDVLKKKVVRRVRRIAVQPQVRTTWQLSERRSCAILGVNRKALHYQPVRRDDPVLRRRIKEIATTRIRYGYKRITVLLRREGWLVNVKRVRRMYREEGLALRARVPKRRRAVIVREARVIPTAPNQSWSMDFMHDVLADGTKIRLLIIVDNFSRESLALEADYGFKSTQVVEVLRRLITGRGLPQRIQCDNGPEFQSVQLDQWAYWNRVKLDFSRPGRPSDNAFCESFNNRVRQELLNPHWFTSLLDVRSRAAEWQRDYNTNHPHSSLANLTPAEFAKRATNMSLQAAISGVAVE
ncbi:MAG: IS3 family transposase [Candidatus Eremiobacter antarcticus]